VPSAQLSCLDEQAAVRTRNAAFLNEALAEIEGISLQALDPRCTRNGHYAYIFHTTHPLAGLPAERFIYAR
jgi:dTDP-4-amino-4,6-dideoxygalactose transaminase